MRVATARIGGGEGSLTGYVQYARSVEHLDATIERLWLFIAAGVLGGTLLASLAGAAVAGRAMRPISNLTATARQIAATGDPSRHMPAPPAEDEVGELARTLEQMLRSLDAARADREAALRRQREFVADASHELRTPLTSIVANLELLQRARTQTRARGRGRAGDGRLGAALLGPDDPARRRSAAARSRRRGADRRPYPLRPGRDRRPGRRRDCADRRRTTAADRERPPVAPRRQPGRTASVGPQPARQRGAPYPAWLDDRTPPAPLRRPGHPRSRRRRPRGPPRSARSGLRPIRPRRRPRRYRRRRRQRPRPSHCQSSSHLPRRHG